VNFPIAILAGGLATRLHPETLDIPKSLIKINNRPFIDFQLYQLAHQGFKDIVLCLGHKADQIIDYVERGEKYNLNVEFSIERKALGTGGALKNASSLLGEKFGILYGDSYLPVDLRKIVGESMRSKKLAVMTVFENLNRFDRSNVRINGNGSIFYSREENDETLTHIDYGFSVMNQKALLRIPNDDVYDLSNLWARLSSENELDGHVVYTRFYEIGSRAGIVDFENFLKGRRVEFY
jgi:MurNAc alpha-1-phosphate uridylyltransferase